MTLEQKIRDRLAVMREQKKPLVVCPFCGEIYHFQGSHRKACRKNPQRKTAEPRCFLGTGPTPGKLL